MNKITTVSHLDGTPRDRVMHGKKHWHRMTDHEVMQAAYALFQRHDDTKVLKAGTPDFEGPSLSSGDLIMLDDGGTYLITPTRFERFYADDVVNWFSSSSSHRQWLALELDTL